MDEAVVEGEEGAETEAVEDTGEGAEETGGETEQEGNAKGKKGKKSAKKSKKTPKYVQWFVFICLKKILFQ